MSDYEDNLRKSDCGMDSCWNDDDDDEVDDDDDGDDQDDSIDNDNEVNDDTMVLMNNDIDENDDNVDREDGGNGGGYDDDDEDDLEQPSKRARFDSMSNYNSDDHTGNETSSTQGTKPPEYDWSHLRIASQIMGKMGHKPGTGLGKHGQGIVEPVAASEQKGTRGLGYRPDESELNRKVDPEVEDISLKEHVRWLNNIYPRSDVPTSNILKGWMVIGPEKLSYDNDFDFCKKKVFQGVLEGKNGLDDIDDTVKVKSRSRANPFETIKGGIFLNRAAMKMANMDYLFDYMFTNPKDQNGKEIIGPDDLLYFADVCAGPGGFSEYVFFRKKWKAKGFGFTLRRMNDFKLEEFFAGPCETFEPHYGVPIDDELGDGDIFKPENITEFSSFVMQNTDGVGVHFMMADGGFSLDEKSNQEMISKQLYLCQCLVALKIVRTNGNFVVKLFDIFTSFSVGLVYLMYRSFDRISIHKPNSSRPANSERYLICQYKRSNCTDVADYLFHVNELLCKRHSNKKDVLELVPMDILKDEKDFYDYIVESNNRLGKRQAFHLENIVYYSKHPDISDSRQEQFKGECLKLWQVPNEARTDPYKGDAKSAIKMLRLNNSDLQCLNEKALEINGKSLAEKWKTLKNWHWVVVESDKSSEALTFYLGMGRKNVYRYVRGSWVKFKNLPNFQLPAGTLLYGETVQENIINPKLGKVQYRVPAFHIVDGWFLGQEDIHKKNILQRRKCCELFAKALSRSNMIYRVKEFGTMKENPYHDLSLSISMCVKPRVLKNRQAVLGYDLEENRFIVPGGLLFFQEIRDGWQLHKSTTQKMYYYFHASTKQSVWKHELSNHGDINENPKLHCDVNADFQTSFSKRRVWWINEEELKELALKNMQNDEEDDN